MEKDFIQKNWFIILTLILFFPIGIYFVWKKRTWDNHIKINITMITTVIIFLIFISITKYVLPPSHSIVSEKTQDIMLQEQIFLEDEEQLSQKEQINVWIPRTGSKYHSDSNCSNMKNPSYTSQSEAESLGYTPCQKCFS